MEPSEKSARLIEAASAILHCAPDRQLNAVVLNKALFYLDLASLRDRASTVTANSYIAIQQGPVVAKYPQRLIQALEAQGIARQLSEWNGSKPIVLEKCPEHFIYLDAGAIALVAKVTGYFSDLTSRAASEYSHDNPGWQSAWNTYRRSGRPAPINMRVAMQQIIEDDPWMETPLIDEDQILAAADADSGEDW